MEDHVYGSGFKIRNYPTIEVPSDDDPEGYFEYITPEAEHRGKLIFEQIKTLRGEAISSCVDIDNMLGQSISRFFFKNDPEKREIFHELILDTTELSFAQKRNILQLIMDKYPNEFGPFSDKRRKQEFFEIVNSIIKTRNALAHGVIIFDYVDNKVFLHYYDKSKNKTQEDELSPEFFKNIKSKINQLVWDFCSGIQSGGIILSDFPLDD
jgi:hypothetical protein